MSSLQKEKKRRKKEKRKKKEKKNKKVKMGSGLVPELTQKNVH
jgi:hypothetical protein